MLKFASATIIHARLGGTQRAVTKAAHRAVFHYDPRPGYLYVRSRAISSRCNDNWDEFPAEEIEKSYRTFVGKPVFINHHNDNHRRARGVCIDAALHQDRAPDGTPDTWAEVLMEVDATRFPKLARAILTGDVARTSMGCDVAYSVCSACGNKATTLAEYCTHIPRLKGKRLYRASATGSKVGELVRETCYGLSFFENSILVEPPADPTAQFLGVDASGLGKAASRKTAAFADKGTLDWDEIARRWPHVYGDPEVHGDRADGADGEGIGEAANYLAHDRADDPDADGTMVHDLEFHREHVDPYHIDHAHHESNDHRVQRAAEGYRTNPTKVPPLVLVHRHGVYQVADGHHRAQGAKLANQKTVRAYVAYSPHPDEPFSDGGTGPYHGAEPHPGQHRTAAKTADHSFDEADFNDPDDYEMDETDEALEAQQARREKAEQQQHTLFERATGHPTERKGVPIEPGTGYPLPMGRVRRDGSPVLTPGTPGYDQQQARQKVRDAVTAPAYTPPPAGLISQNQLRADGTIRDETPDDHSEDDQPEASPAERLKPMYDRQRVTDRAFDRVTPHETRPVSDQWRREMKGPPRQDHVDRTPTGGVYRKDYPERLRERREKAVTHSQPYRPPMQSLNALADPEDIMVDGTLRTRAYGEVKAPADVDTLREEACPVCGSTDETYDGMICQTCGFISPPEQFRDPDLDRAKQLDLRKQIADPGQVGPDGQVIGEDGQQVPGQEQDPGLAGPEQLDENGLLPSPYGDQALDGTQREGPGMSDRNGDGMIQPNEIDEDGNANVVDPELGGQPGPRELPADAQDRTGQPFTPGPNMPEQPGGPEGPDALLDEQQVEAPAPGEPGDGVGDLLCPSCGFSADATPPQTQNMADPAAGSDGVVAGDVCPNCQQAQLLSPGEMEGNAAVPPPAVPRAPR